MKRISARLFFPSVLITGVLLTLAPCAKAKPDFTASEIKVATPTVLEGDVAHFKVLLRNKGDEAAEAPEVRIQWPLMGHLVSIAGLDDAKTDHDAHETTASVSLPAGGERVVDVAVLAPRDSGGNTLAMTVQIIHYHTMAENWIHASVAIDTRIRADGFRMGGLRITTAGVLTLVWLAVSVVAVLLASWLARIGDSSRFFGPRAGVMAVMIAIGFWLVFAAMAWHDYRVLFQWKETIGTIIGRRVNVQTVSSSQRLSSGATSQTRQHDVAKPEFAVRYQVDGRDRLSTGYDTGSSLRVGGGKAQLEKEFLEWNVGAQVPCWYDPQDPTDIVVKRGFGGAYIFALLPLFPFWMGLSILRHAFKRSNSPS